MHGQNHIKTEFIP